MHVIFRQLFDSTSGTYTYLLASRHGGEALIIDPVLERVDRYLQLVRELDLKLVKAVEISKGTVGLIKQNYAIVAGLNTLALGLALPGGLITPEVTALISNGSAILASMNGVRPILRYQ